MRPTLSLCLIARDSSRTLGACLASIRPWVDEIVVVDTGSLDNTREIAREHGARVFEFAWRDDFSAARNASIGHARGQWIFWMDSDDTIDPVNGRRLRELADSHHPQAVLGFVMQVHCPSQGAANEVGMTVVDHVKMFRRAPGMQFEGRIHEQVLPAIRRLGGDVAWTDIHVVHSGCDQSEAGRLKKRERDLRILNLELAEQPNHPFTLFNLGMTHADGQEHARAIEFLERSISVATGGESHLRKAYALLISSLVAVENAHEACRWCERARGLFPNDPELLFRSAMLAHHSGRLEQAEQEYLHILEQARQPGERYFSSMDLGITSYKPRHNLAAIYCESGRPEMAELQWRIALKSVPDYEAGWRSLLDCLVSLGRFRTAALEIERLLARPQLRPIALLARSKLAEARGDYTAALQDIELAIVESPGLPEPLEARCRLLFEHADPARAKGALLQLLQVSPHDPAVLHNLGAICGRMGQYDEAIDSYERSLKFRPHAERTLRELAAIRAAAGHRDGPASKDNAAVPLPAGRGQKSV